MERVTTAKTAVGARRKHRRRNVILGPLMVATMTAATMVGGVSASGGAGTGIVAGAVKAPIVPDGDVAGAPTDVVIILDTSLDPDVAGRTLLAGKTIKVTLPDDFVNLGMPVVNPGPCAAAGACSTGVLLQGWPQHPIPPSPANYTVTVDPNNANTIVYTATVDLTPAPPLEPGIKQMHLILRGFVNPGPGRYELAVEAQTGPGGAVETGVAVVHIRSNPRASINVTSVPSPPASPPFLNTIYQHAAPGDATPLPYDFFLWDKHGEPAVGVVIDQVNSNHAVLRQGKRVVGQITIDAPPGASGQEISGGPSTGAVPAPVLGMLTSRLTAQFVAGDTPGLYTTTFSMNNGNSVQMFVDVS